MSYLESLYLPGAVALWCALAFALTALWGYSRVLRGDESARPFARRAYAFFALAVVLTAWVLLILLARRDFRIEYVYQYSGLDLPWFFQLAAFWAGQKGSFLIWLFWGVLLGLPLRRAAGRDEAPVMGVYLLTLLGLLFILVRENPFVMLGEAPVDGKGLNPLLQDNWMVIHPPIMFIGYAASAIPFSFALAALWRRRTSEWARRAFPWALIGFLVLGTAILLGGYWAYKTLGWGGFWGWDPVENASLIPWIFGTALIHGLYMERSRGRFRRTNFLFAALLYLSVLYGTFLTRSGVLADFSVHSFVDLGISGWLIALMAFFLGATVWLLATRLPGVETRRNEDPLLSRGSLLVLATAVLTVAGLVVTVGTSSPLLTGFLENPGQVGPEFYNRVTQPLAILIVLLLALVPYLGWRATEGRWLLRRLALPAALAALATGLAAAIAVRNPLHLLFVFVATLAALTNLGKTIELGRSAGLRRAGGYLAHVGVGVLFLGFVASSAYDSSSKVTLVQGEPRQVRDLTLTFERFLPRTAEQKERLQIRVERAGGAVYTAYPRLYVNDRTRQLMAHPDINSLPLKDLYISPIEFVPGVPRGGPVRVEVARGGATELGELTIRFVDFDLTAAGNALAQMSTGERVTVGAILELGRDGSTTRLTPLYSFDPSGRVEADPVPIPGGGAVRLAGINATDDAVYLDFLDLEAAGARPDPPRVAVDVTTKPLIQLVWAGVWIVLAGGVLATTERFRRLARRSG